MGAEKSNKKYSSHGGVTGSSHGPPTSTESEQRTPQHNPTRRKDEFAPRVLSPPISKVGLLSRGPVSITPGPRTCPHPYEPCSVCSRDACHGAAASRARRGLHGPGTLRSAPGPYPHSPPDRVPQTRRERVESGHRGPHNAAPSVRGTGRGRVLCWAPPPRPVQHRRGDRGRRRTRIPSRPHPRPRMRTLRTMAPNKARRRSMLRPRRADQQRLTCASASP